MANAQNAKGFKNKRILHRCPVIIFVKKMVQRCGLWQIKCMTSQDLDQVSTKSIMFGFGGYSQMKF